MQSLNKAMQALKEVSGDQARVAREALQEVLNKGDKSLSIEYRMKEKNRRILSLEADRQKLQTQLAVFRRQARMEALRAIRDTPLPKRFYATAPCSECTETSDWRPWLISATFL